MATKHKTGGEGGRDTPTQQTSSEHRVPPQAAMLSRWPGPGWSPSGWGEHRQETRGQMSDWAASHSDRRGRSGDKRASDPGPLRRGGQRRLPPRKKTVSPAPTG